MLFVTGGSSYLGRHLLRAIPPTLPFYYSYHHHDPFGWENGRSLDLRNQTAVSALFAQIKPKTIIHLAGSNRIADMQAVIEDGTGHVVQAAQAVGARLVHLSTDSIFDGQNPPYAETAVATPVNAYGRAKATAEHIVQAFPNHVIIRTSLIYGLKEMDHGTAWMAQAIEQNQPITLFENQVRNPVWVQTLVNACLELVDHDFRGTLNVAGNQVLTRATFALKMFDYWQIKKRDSVTIGTSSKQWPLNCELDLTLATAVLKTPLLGVDEVLSFNHHKPTKT